MAQPLTKLGSLERLTRDSSKSRLNLVVAKAGQASSFLTNIGRRWSE